jgi:hypothetical protein
MFLVKLAAMAGAVAAGMYFGSASGLMIDLLAATIGDTVAAAPAIANLAWATRYEDLGQSPGDMDADPSNMSPTAIRGEREPAERCRRGAALTCVSDVQRFATRPRS